MGKLRQHASKEVSDFAKDVVKKWKAQVDKEKQSTAGGGKGYPNGKGAFQFDPRGRLLPVMISSRKSSWDADYTNC